MATAVYVLCALTSGLCAALLARMYRRTGVPLLLWCTLSFVGWTLANVLVFMDMVVLPDVDLLLTRTIAGVVAVALMLGGLVWHGE